MSIAAILISSAIVSSALVSVDGENRGWLGWFAGLAPLVALPVRMGVEITAVSRSAMGSTAGLASHELMFAAVPIGVCALAMQRITPDEGDSLRTRAGLQLGLAGLVYGGGIDELFSGGTGLLAFSVLAFIGVVVLPELLLRLSNRRFVRA